MSVQSELRLLPGVDRLLNDPRLEKLSREHSRTAVATLVREHLEACRQSVLSGDPAPDTDSLIEGILTRSRDMWEPWPGHVINATGVVLHTNMGRAPMSRAAIEAAARAAGGYSNLELDMESGKRGSRRDRISELLARVTGAEEGIAVNNNAMAVLLGLEALAAGREVLVSRGEAVEIGGGFRVPDVLKQSGTTLVEVGTTNRTYASDYEAGITAATGALLKVHRSNFSLTGFTHEVSVEEMVALGRRCNVPVLHDIGSGCLLDTADFGMDHEPTVQESVSAGADVVFFSGDKLLGGPQAGIAVGRREHIKALARHPLARATRLDKMTLAALYATLTAYARGVAEREIPIWQMISATPDTLEARSIAWQKAIERGQVTETRSTVGGGSLPGQTLPTAVLVLDPACGPDEFCARLRRTAIPVVARIENDRVFIDPRTVLPDEDESLLHTLRAALTEGQRQ